VIEGPSNHLCLGRDKLNWAGAYSGFHIFDFRDQPAQALSNLVGMTLPPPSTNLTFSGQPVPKLGHFVAYTLHRTRLASCVTFAAFFLLQRLKNRFPAARGSSVY
jgi:hypothetical protein